MNYFKAFTWYSQHLRIMFLCENDTCNFMEEMLENERVMWQKKCYLGNFHECILNIWFDFLPVVNTAVFEQTFGCVHRRNGHQDQKIWRSKGLFADCLQFSKTVLNMQKEQRPTTNSKLVWDHALLLLLSRSLWVYSQLESCVFILSVLMSSRQWVAC